MAHRHPDLTREIAELRAEIRQLRRIVTAMSVLQTAARIVLGTPFTELLDSDSE
jgi:hypothetical protein